MLGKLRHLLIDTIQVLITSLVFLGCLTARFLRRNWTIDWVAGPDDEVGVLPNVCSVLRKEGQVLSVVTTPQSTHALSGSLVVGTGSSRLLKLLTFGPTAVGIGIAHRSRFFLTGRGELLRNGRVQDRILRWRSLSVTWMFLGSDIRSPERFSEFMENNGHLSFTDFQHERSGVRVPDTERRVKELADRAMQVSDLIISPKFEQASYLDFTEDFVKSRLCMIAVPDQVFDNRGGEPPKISWSNPIRVLHAPSNRAVKGTLIVREAILELKRAGIQIDYQELTGVPNATVLAELEQSDVLINSLMQHTPGMLGLEGLALGKLVIMAADPDLEPAIPAWRAGADAWLRFHPGNLFSLLADVAKHPKDFDPIRREGFNYCREHFSLSERSRELRQLLDLTGHAEGC